LAAVKAGLKVAFVFVKTFLTDFISVLHTTFRFLHRSFKRSKYKTNLHGLELLVKLIEEFEEINSNFQNSKRDL